MKKKHESKNAGVVGEDGYPQRKDEEVQEKLKACNRMLLMPRFKKFFRHPWVLSTIKVVDAYYKLTEKSFETEASLFWGDKMSVILPEKVSSKIYSYQIFEPSLSMYLFNTLREGSVFLDVGAHFGYFSAHPALESGHPGISAEAPA